MKRNVMFLISFFLAMTVHAEALWTEEGVTDTEIHIGSFGPLTGPISPWGIVLYGSGFLFDLANNEGGIHGRKIVYHMVDDRYISAKTKADVKMMQEKEKIFAWVGGIGTNPCYSVRKFLVDRNIPWIAPVTGEQKVWGDPLERNIFPFYSLWQMESGILVHYAIKNLRLSKIAVIYQDDGYGRAGLEGVERELTKNELKLVAQLILERREPNFAEAANQLRDAKAEAAIMILNPFFALGLMKAALSMNYTPQWMGPSSLSDFEYLYSLSKGIYKGVITASWFQYEDTRTMENYRKAFLRTNGKPENFNEQFRAGIAFAEPVVAALKHCGRELTREKFIQAMESLGEFQGVAAPVTYKPFNIQDPTCRLGIQKIYLIQCGEKGARDRISDWIQLDK